MLIFKNLGQAMACNILELIVALKDKLHEHGYKIIVNLRHVEQMYSLDKVVYQL